MKSFQTSSSEKGRYEHVFQSGQLIRASSTEACEIRQICIVANCAFLSRQSGTWCERSVRLRPSFALGSFPNQKMQMTVMLRAPWYKGYKGYKGSPPKPPKPYVLSLAPMAPMPSGRWKSALVLCHREILHWSHLVSSWNSWCKVGWQEIQVSNQDRTQFQWLDAQCPQTCARSTRVFSTLHHTFCDIHPACSYRLSEPKRRRSPRGVSWKNLPADFGRLKTIQRSVHNTLAIFAESKTMRHLLAKMPNL